MEDMSPNEEAAFFGAPALASPERRLRHWLDHQDTHVAQPDDVRQVLDELDDLRGLVGAYREWARQCPIREKE